MAMNKKTISVNQPDVNQPGKFKKDLGPPLLVLLAALLAALGFVLIRLGAPYTWYVEEGLEAGWQKVLDEADSPRGFKTALVMVKPGALPPENARGFFITTHRARTAEKVTVYPRLSFDLEYEGAQVLALDPWMIFRDHRQSALSRGRIEAVGEGELLLPGWDEAVFSAWTAQLVRDRAGAFPIDKTVWDNVRAALPRDSRFFRGSATMNWQDVWFFLFMNRPAWVYAPLSRTRELPSFRSSLLEASVFPAGGGVGLQARILWAVPLGSGRLMARLKEAPLRWLKDPGNQTIIANAFEWLPADPDGEPFNPLAVAAKRAWLTSSFVWEDGEL
jgi:hypothetical protein